MRKAIRGSRSISKTLAERPSALRVKINPAVYAGSGARRSWYSPPRNERGILTFGLIPLGRHQLDPLVTWLKVVIPRFSVTAKSAWLSIPSAVTDLPFHRGRRLFDRVSSRELASWCPSPLSSPCARAAPSWGWRLSAWPSCAGLPREHGRERHGKRWCQRGHLGCWAQARAQLHRWDSHH